MIKKILITIFILFYYFGYSQVAICRSKTEIMQRYSVDANSALLLNPKIANCYLLKGRSYYRLGKKTEASVEWQKAVDLGDIDALDYLSQYCK